MFEGLEYRRLLSSTLTSGLLKVTGTNSDETIALSLSGSKIKVTQTGQASISFTASSVKKISIDAKGGKDTVNVSGGITKPATILGGTGNDTLLGGGGDDSIDGGADNDLLTGAGGNDTILGGTGSGKDALIGSSGDDVLDGGLGDDFIDGGKGSNTADYSSRTSKVIATIDFNTSNPPDYIPQGGGGVSGEHDTYSDVETLLGGSAGDNLTFDCTEVLSGAKRSFLIKGNGGGDTLTAGSAPLDDLRSQVTLEGDSGNDHFVATMGPSITIRGGSGDDVANFGDEDSRGNASADMGSGHDTAEFNAEADTPLKFTIPANCEDFIGGGAVEVFGNDLNNHIEINEAFSETIVHGGKGDDTIVYDKGMGHDNGHLKAFGDSGKDSIDGGDGDDVIDGGAGNDTVQGFNGDDSITGGDNDDLLLGNAGADTIHGGSGKDQIFGGTGNDSLFGDGDADKINGENDDDRIFAKDNTKDSVDGGSGSDFAQIDAGAVVDSVKNVESESA